MDKGRFKGSFSGILCTRGQADSRFRPVRSLTLDNFEAKVSKENISLLER